MGDYVHEPELDQALPQLDEDRAPATPVWQQQIEQLVDRRTIR